jgi:hypothetical protein
VAAKFLVSRVRKVADVFSRYIVELEPLEYGHVKVVIHLPPPSAPFGSMLELGPTNATILRRRLAREPDLEPILEESGELCKESNAEAIELLPLLQRQQSRWRTVWRGQNLISVPVRDWKLRPGPLPFGDLNRTTLREHVPKMGFLLLVLWSVLI